MGWNIGNKNTSSNWMMATVYGGLAIAAINPIAGAVTAFACYKVHKKLKAEEDVERARSRQQNQQEFNERFYARQHYASYEDYLVSDAWQEKRAAIYMRAFGKCEKPESPRVTIVVAPIEPRNRGRR